MISVHPRHPLVLASAAKTAQAATGGRSQLGIGLGPAASVKFAYRPACCPGRRRPRIPRGHDHRADTPDDRRRRAEPEILVIVAAMGPQALRATGELADGTLPFLAGPRALAEHIAPTITDAAAQAGRAAPRIVVAIHAVVTTTAAELDTVTAAAVRQMAF